MSSLEQRRESPRYELPHQADILVQRAALGLLSLFALALFIAFGDWINGLVALLGLHWACQPLDRCWF